MADPDATNRIPLRNRFPELRLFDTAGLALSPGSIVIAVLASLLVALIGRGLDRVMVPDAKIAAHVVFDERVPGAIGSIPGFELEQSPRWHSPWTIVARPAIYTVTTSDGMAARFSGLIRLVIIFAIWSLAGLILCRRAATLFVGDDQSSLQDAVEYGSRRWSNSVSGPAIPIFAALVVGLVILIGGLVGRLPWVGSAWLTMTSPLAALFGFGMAVLLLSALCGWPLMAAAIAIDDCDGFGALSRTCSGIAGRPWHLVGYVFVCTLVGAILTVVVQIFGDATIWCAVSATSLGSGEAVVKQSLVDPVTSIVRLVEAGIMLSFFWSAATVIALLLRREVDGVPIDQIAPDHVIEVDPDPLPVVGIPATDSRIQINGHMPTEAVDDQRKV